MFNTQNPTFLVTQLSEIDSVLTGNSAEFVLCYGASHGLFFEIVREHNDVTAYKLKLLIKDNSFESGYVPEPVIETVFRNRYIFETGNECYRSALICNIQSLLESFFPEQAI